MRWNCIPTRSATRSAQQAAELDDSVMNGINAVRHTSENITRHTMKAIDGLAKQSGVLQNVAETLFSQIHGVTDRFENQGQQILKAANVLDTANIRIDSALQSRHAELAHTLDRFSGKADEFGRTLAGYSTHSRRLVDEHRAQGAGHRRRTSRRRRKPLSRAHGGTRPGQERNRSAEQSSHCRFAQPLP